MQSRKSRNTWSYRQIWPWNMEWSRAKTDRVLPRKCTGHNKHPLPTTQEKTIHHGLYMCSIIMCWCFHAKQSAHVLSCDFLSMTLDLFVYSYVRVFIYWREGRYYLDALDFKQKQANNPSQTINKLLSHVTGIPKVGKEDSQADWPLWSIMSLRACWQRCIHACLAAQLCLTFCDPMDCHPPGSSVHGILQAKTLEPVANPYSRGSSWLRDQTHISCLLHWRWILYH